MASLVEMLYEIEAAELEAARLRNRYGAGAQTYWDRLLSRTPDSDPRKPSLKRVRKALQGLH